MEGIKYVNLIQISPMVIEIRGVENGKLAVLVNNILVHHTAFLAADTQLCFLMSLSDKLSFLLGWFYSANFGVAATTFHQIL